MYLTVCSDGLVRMSCGCTIHGETLRMFKISYAFISSASYDHVRLQFQNGATRANTDINEWWRIVSVSNPCIWRSQDFNSIMIDVFSLTFNRFEMYMKKSTRRCWLPSFFKVPVFARSCVLTTAKRDLPGLKCVSDMLISDINFLNMKVFALTVLHNYDKKSNNSFYLPVMTHHHMYIYINVCLQSLFRCR